MLKNAVILRTANMQRWFFPCCCYVLYISNLNALSFAVKVKNMKIHYHSSKIFFCILHIYVQNSLVNSTHVFYYSTTFILAKALHHHHDLRIMKTEIKRWCCRGRGEAHMQLVCCRGPNYSLQVYDDMVNITEIWNLEWRGMWIIKQALKIYVLSKCYYASSQ